MTATTVSRAADTLEDDAEDAQESINGRLYRQSNLIQTYLTTKLSPCESTTLVRYRDHILNRRVLDLGCGAGRLTTYLRPLTTDYVGLDVSPYMIDYCRETFAELEFSQGDMRSLRQFTASTFAAIFAVANLFDAVSHDERLKILSEMHRLLTDDGVLIFSSHNRNFCQAGWGPKLRFQRNPLTQIRVMAEYLQASINHRRNKRHHRFEPDYALLNDSGNNYETLHYYIARDVQARQLTEAGLDLIECLDDFGRTLRPSDPDNSLPSIMYVARKTVDRSEG